MDSYLRAAWTEIEGATRGLGPDQLARAAALPGRWTIPQILEHLMLAFAGNTKAFEKALASGEARGRPAVLKQRIGRLLVVDLGYFPKARAPEMTIPSGSVPPEQIVEAVRLALDTLDGTLDRVAARFGDDALVANHPYFGGMTVAQWRKFHWRHTVHHARQIRRLSTPNTPTPNTPTPNSQIPTPKSQEPAPD
jgi:hypothetical protein